MTDAEVGEIAERLTRVERKIRRYRAALVGVGLIAMAGASALLFVWRAKVPETIRAKRFQVVDDAGTVRAALGTNGAAARLDLYDKAGKERVTLATVGDNARLDLSNKAGKTRAALGNTELKNERTGSTEHRPVSSLVLFRENGKVL